MDKIWKDKKHWMWFPMPFTKYSITEDRFLTETGLISKEYNEIYLFRVKDVKLNVSLGQKLFGTGTITLISNDSSSPRIEIENIKEPLRVKEMISKMVIQQRKENRVMEISGTELNYEDLDGDGFPDFL